ncbi:unnamed protein product [Vitrella brassicaformis CCMP3155]|uniref:Uncharacterized protein n=1 Tax=Vitrella brassicaformis (strain CCMP3155) TaxID=1169540 RepID=A0A0G4EA85_VITBC|nr:unnamed protein product [Vitrella brassicaformis CCMP3155]|eukprot:CEL92508.1 unnamed protein product [Vitrella brassicaformis CCMP3155]
MGAGSSTTVDYDGQVYEISRGAHIRHHEDLSVLQQSAGGDRYRIAERLIEEGYKDGISTDREAYRPEAQQQQKIQAGTRLIKEMQLQQQQQQRIHIRQPPAICRLCPYQKEIMAFYQKEGEMADIEDHIICGICSKPIRISKEGEVTVPCYLPEYKEKEEREEAGFEYGKVLSRRVDYESRTVVADNFIDSYRVQRMGDDGKVVDEFLLEMREHVVEVPEIITMEKFVQIPKLEIQEREVVVPVRHFKEKIVEVPQVQIVEKIVEVPEYIGEREEVIVIPEVETVEKVMAIPGPTEIRERIVEVPHIEYREVPVERVEYQVETVYEEKVREVKRTEIQYKEVLVEKIVEVPHVQYETKDVYVEKPIPKYEVKPVYVEVPFVVKRQVPVERVVEVPYEVLTVKDKMVEPQMSGIDWRSVNLPSAYEIEGGAGSVATKTTGARMAFQSTAEQAEKAGIINLTEAGPAERVGREPAGFVHPEMTHLRPQPGTEIDGGLVVAAVGQSLAGRKEERYVKYSGSLTSSPPGGRVETSSSSAAVAQPSSAAAAAAAAVPIDREGEASGAGLGVGE